MILGVVAERVWGPGLEAEQDGVVAREACGHLSENHCRAGTAGSKGKGDGTEPRAKEREMGLSSGPAETEIVEIGGGGRKGRKAAEGHTRRDTVASESGGGGGEVRVVKR